MSTVGAESAMQRAGNTLRAGRRAGLSSWVDPLFQRTTQFFALLVFSLLAAILVSLVIGSWPSIT